MEFIKSRLLNEDVERHHLAVKVEPKAEPSSAFAGKGGKFTFKCHACGKPGHKKADCPEKKKAEQAAGSSHRRKKGKAHAAETKDGANDDVSFVSVTQEANSVETHGKFRWVLDSGASEHMVGEKGLLVNIRRMESPTVINVAKAGVTLEGRYVGDVKMKADIGTRTLNCTVRDVLYVPGLLTNLFSVKKVAERGMEVTFGQEGARITKDGEIKCTAKQNGRLYELDVKVVRGSAMVGESESKLSLWHRRYGHIGNTGLMKLIRNEMVEGLDVGKNAKPEKEICACCMKGKQARLPFEEATKPRSSRPLELIHSDVCGPFNPASWNGKKMFVSFIDDYTHFAAVYILEAKSEVLDAFRKYAAMATAHFGTKIARLRSDIGREYINTEFKKYCDDAGIVMEPTVPYTPEQNGKSERFNRTVMERARAMMEDAEIDWNMWSEAVLAAVHVINRSPTAALRGAKTPYEMWFGRKPNVSKLRVFGSKAYTHIPKEKRSKLSAKSHVCVLVGYGMNGYRLWDPVKKQVIVARDVKVEEKVMHKQVYTDDHMVSDSIVRQQEHEDLDSDDDPDPEQEEEEVVEVLVDSEAESESDDEVFDQEVPDEEDQVPEENAAPEQEEAAAERRSGRARKRPARFSDYELEQKRPARHDHDVCVAFALNAEAYVDEIPDTIEALQKRDDWPLWKRAIEDELRSLEKNRTWDLVEAPAGRRVVSCKWVFRIKKKEDGTAARYKARLVAKGCSQRAGYDYQETYAPVVRMSTVRTLLAVAVQQNLHLHQMDVRTAFLNGHLNETVYMRQPPGFERGSKVCKLNKSLYGLKQAPRSWNERFNQFILKLGFKRSPYDCCLYTMVTKDVKLYLVLYVDDIVLASNSLEELKNVKVQLAKEFEMEDLEELRNFLGLKIERDVEKGTLTINQSQYVSGLLKRFGMDQCKPLGTPLEANVKLARKKDEEAVTEHPYRELIGCLTYLMLSSRPDISIAVNFLSRFQSAATDTHWIHLKRVLRYLQGTKEFSLEYKRSETADPLVGFADADWGSDIDDRRSTSGFVFKVFGNTVSWTSRKQATVSLSSTEAEYVSLSQAACESIWLMNLLSDFGIALDAPAVIHEDNQSCIHIAEEPRDQKRMKHLDIRYNYIRECIQDELIKVQYIPTKDQLADVFTKGLPAVSFKKHRSTLGLRGGVVSQP